MALFFRLTIAKKNQIKVVPTTKVLMKTKTQNPKKRKKAGNQQPHFRFSNQEERKDCAWKAATFLRPSRKVVYYRALHLRVGTNLVWSLYPLCPKQATLDTWRYYAVWACFLSLLFLKIDSTKAPEEEKEGGKLVGLGAKTGPGMDFEQHWI